MPIRWHSQFTTMSNNASNKGDFQPKILFVVVFNLLIFCFQCEEPITPIIEPPLESKENYLVIGDTVNNTKYFEYHNDDTVINLLGGIWGEINTDFNITNSSSITFHSYYQSHTGGELDIRYCKLKVNNNVQVAVDTSLKDIILIDMYTNELIDSHKEDIVSPLKMNIGDTIQENLIWISDTTLVLTKYDDVTYPSWAQRRYDGWNSNNAHYLAFRVVENDTLIGWIKMQCYYHNSIIKYEFLLY
jgi:hypothetical protein